MYYTAIRPIIKKAYYFLVESFLNMLSILLFWIRPISVDKPNIKKILLIKLERIGDLALSEPAIREIRKHFPQSRIFMIVNPYTKAVVKELPCLDEVFDYDKNARLKDKLDFIRFLRGYKFDLAIDWIPR